MVTNKSNGINNVLTINSYLGYRVNCIDEYLGYTTPNRYYDVRHYLIGAFYDPDLSFIYSNILMDAMFSIKISNPMWL